MRIFLYTKHIAYTQIQSLIQSRIRQNIRKSNMNHNRTYCAQTHIPKCTHQKESPIPNLLTHQIGKLWHIHQSRNQKMTHSWRIYTSMERQRMKRYKKYSLLGYYTVYILTGQKIKWSTYFMLEFSWRCYLKLLKLLNWFYVTFCGLFYTRMYIV